MICRFLLVPADVSVLISVIFFFFSLEKVPSLLVPSLLVALGSGWGSGACLFFLKKKVLFLFSFSFFSSGKYITPNIKKSLNNVQTQSKISHRTSLEGSLKNTLVEHRTYRKDIRPLYVDIFTNPNTSAKIRITQMLKN